jgi:His-Xaa-Ser system protein HxsD
MLLTRRMPQAATERSATRVSIGVEFDASIQALSALEAAAYRLIGTATCQIERVGSRFVCALTTQNDRAGEGITDADALRTRFLNLVTDENMRARVSEKTDGVRNVILALAFGSLASTEDST